MVRAVLILLTQLLLPHTACEVIMGSIPVMAVVVAAVAVNPEGMAPADAHGLSSPCLQLP